MAIRSLRPKTRSSPRPRPSFGRISPASSSPSICPLSMSGTAFQRRVWEALRAIPYGETASYGKVAAAIGLVSRRSSRAVGLANGANPIPIVVPCHRVIGANGSLTGYGGGLERKQYLLTLELTHA